MLLLLVSVVFSIHFAPCAKRILAEMSNLLYELGEISGETIFIDGTKNRSLRQ